jgi:hypothetical protein
MHHVLPAPVTELRAPRCARPVTVNVGTVTVRADCPMATMRAACECVIFCWPAPESRSLEPGSPDGVTSVYPMRPVEETGTAQRERPPRPPGFPVWCRGRQGIPGTGKDQRRQAKTPGAPGSRPAREGRSVTVHTGEIQEHQPRRRDAQSGNNGTSVPCGRDAPSGSLGLHKEPGCSDERIGDVRHRAGREKQCTSSVVLRS